MLEMDINDLMRASTVKRWHMEDVPPQTVADHSFRVMLLVNHVLSKMQPPPTLDEYRLAMVWTMFHDLPEILTGDLYTGIKTHLPPGVYHGLEQKTSSTWRYLDQTLAYSHWKLIVKICDAIEGWVYYRRYGREERVLDGLWKSVMHLMEMAKKDFPAVDWKPLIRLPSDLSQTHYLQLEDVIDGQ